MFTFRLIRNLTLWILVAGTVTNVRYLSAAEAKKKSNATQTAWLRIWSGDIPSNRSLAVRMRASGRKATASDRVDNLWKYRFAEYTAVPAGALTIDIIDTKNDKGPLATVLAQVATESFWTLLIRESGAEVHAEIIEDTPTENGTGALSIRNFAPTLSVLLIDGGPDLHIKLTSPESFIHLQGLNHDRFQLETSGSEVSGNVLQWTNTVDFSKYSRATLLIYPDPYGRIRPRVVVDGQIISDPAETSPESAPNTK